jgi:hypothetical protein
VDIVELLVSDTGQGGDGVGLGDEEEDEGCSGKGLMS